VRRFTLVLLCLVFPATASAQVDHWGKYAKAIETPTALSGLEDVVKVQAGNASGQALEADGSDYTFGHGEGGQLGNGKETDSESPLLVKFPETVDVVAVAEAKDTDFAISATGQVWQWGELAFCGTTPSSTPEKLPVTDAISGAGGAGHVLFLTSERTVLGCGGNGNGELGLPPGEVATPTVIPGLSEVAEVTSGDATSCARTQAGVVYCMGANSLGQVGDGNKSQADKATAVALPGPASEVYEGGDNMGDGSTVALVEGAVYGWGCGEEGQLGNGKEVNEDSPVQASEFTGLHIGDIATAGEATYGVSETGDVYALGSRLGYMLGDGSKRGHSLTPELIDTGKVEVSGTASEAVDR
jgi:alpha-tubulin suppressor-like RCC1 family protein